MATVLITGATSGIGRATCKLFAQRCGEGTKIVALGRRENLLAEVTAEIESYGAQATSLACDVADESAVNEALGSLGDVDILVRSCQ